MGNSEGVADKFLSRYKFIELINDSNFGSIKIYRKKQLYFDYIMIVDRYIHESSQYKYKNQLNTIQLTINNIEEPMLLKIFQFQAVDKNLTECNLPFIRLYIEYYNYTLSQLLHKRLSQGHQVTYEEIIYIMKTVLTAIQILIKINPNMITCSIDSIFITPEGTIKLSPIQINGIERTNGICQNLCSNQQIPLNLQKTTTQIIYDVKRLFADLTKFTKRNNRSEIANKFINLERQINSAKTISQIRNIIPPSSINSLNIKKKDNESSSDHNPTAETPPYLYEPNMQNPVKKSMKKCINK